MFARVTHYKMKPDSVPEAMAKLDQMKPQIMALPGMVQFVNTVNDDGTGCVVSIVESREISDANAGAVQQIWAAFADYLMEAPVPEGFEVTANWTA